jgi:hypothetical protein
MIIAIKPPALEVPIVISAYRKKPLFLKEVSEREVGRVNGHRVVRKDYEYPSWWPLIREFRAYKVYEIESGNEIGFSFGFPYLNGGTEKMFYMQKFKTKNREKNMFRNIKNYFEMLRTKVDPRMISNFRTFSKRAIEDIFREEHSHVVGLMKNRLVKMLERAKWEKKELKGFSGFLAHIWAGLYGGTYMEKEKK